MSKKTSFKVCLSKTELHDRGPIITGLMKSLVKKPTDIFPLSRPLSPDRLAWAVQKAGSKTQGGHRGWRFPTNVKGIQATYFEEWQRFYEGNEEAWHLELAYLHIYRTDPTNNTAPEYLLLHCDPNETREHAIYKQSPHLHIEVAPQPWPKAHIALNVGYLEPMLQDAASLTKSLELAVVMLKNQVLDELTT